MTVIAWDGAILAADKQITYGDTIKTCTKIFKVGDDAVAFCGTNATAMRLLDWYRSGSDKKKWPESLQMGDYYCEMIVANKDGVKVYQQQPYPTFVEGHFTAWGAGREVAIGAMAMGADAVRAVEIASYHCEGCGRGIDFFEVLK